MQAGQGLRCISHARPVRQSGDWGCPQRGALRLQCICPRSWVVQENPDPSSAESSEGDTFVGSVFDLAEANRLRPTWHSSDLQKSKGESEPPPP